MDYPRKNSKTKLRCPLTDTTNKSLKNNRVQSYFRSQSFSAQIYTRFSKTGFRFNSSSSTGSTPQSVHPTDSLWLKVCIFLFSFLQLLTTSVKIFHLIPESSNTLPAGFISISSLQNQCYFPNNSLICSQMPHSLFSSKTLG